MLPAHQHFAALHLQLFRIYHRLIDHIELATFYSGQDLFAGMQTNGEDIKSERARQNAAYQAKEQCKQDFVGRPLLGIQVYGEWDLFQGSAADRVFMQIVDVDQTA
ncbi:hypothetical protein D3C85_1697140 [compost metagenome]